MIAIQWSRQEGYPAQSVDDRLLCVLCPNWCGVFGTWGSPSDDSPLFFAELIQQTGKGCTCVD